MKDVRIRQETLTMMLEAGVKMAIDRSHANHSNILPVTSDLVCSLHAMIDNLALRVPWTSPCNRLSVTMARFSMSFPRHSMSRRTSRWQEH